MRNSVFACSEKLSKVKISAMSFSLLHTILRMPFHLQMSAGVSGGRKSKTLIKPRSAVCFLYVEGYRHPFFFRFVKQIANKRGPDSAAAILGQKRDVGKPDLAI